MYFLKSSTKPRSKIQLKKEIWEYLILEVPRHSLCREFFIKRVQAIRNMWGHNVSTPKKQLEIWVYFNCKILILILNFSLDLGSNSQSAFFSPPMWPLSSYFDNISLVWICHLFYALLLYFFDLFVLLIKMQLKSIINNI